MSNSNKASNITSYIIRKLWTTVAIALVVVALFISFLRYSLPYIDSYKAYIQNYISEQYAVNLSIGELSASWESSGPALVLRNVNIQQGAQSPIALDIAEVFVEIEFWPSIWSQKLQSSQVLLNRLNVDLNLDQIETSASDFPIVSALENIFLAQLSAFSVTDSRLLINSEKNSQKILINQLSWLNQGNRHQGVGVFAIQDFSANNAKFILDLYGDAFSYSGTLYAEATDVDSSAWFNEFTGLDDQLETSKGNIEFWARIDNGNIKRVDGNILPTTLNWNANGLAVHNRIEGHFGARANDQGWDFSLPNLAISINEQKMAISLLGSVSDTQGLQLYTTEGFHPSPAIPMLGLLSPALAEQLAAVDFQASVDNLQLLINQNGPSLQANIRDVGWQEDDALIGLQALSADILWHDRKGKLNFFTENTQLYSSYLFERNIPLQALTLPVYLDLDSSEQINLRQGSMIVDDMNINVDATYAIDSEFLSLTLDLDAIELAKVPSLLPNHAMGAGAKTFLSSAFAGDGKIERTNFSWHGPIFANSNSNSKQEGGFKSTVVISDADFTFSKDWPTLKDLDIELLFENKRLKMRSESSMLDKVVLSNLSAEIPDLTQNAMLTINANAGADSSDLTALMMQSSLANSLGKILQNSVQIQGELSTQLSLYIPLNDGSKTRAVGEVLLANNQINLPQVNLTFEQASGIVSFDNQSISVDGLQAQLFDQAIKVGLRGNQETDKYQLQANFTGAWEATTLTANLSKEFASYFSGETDWSLDLSLDLYPDDFHYSAQLTSDLIGIESYLPEPLHKRAEDRELLFVTASGDKLASSVEINLQDKVRFDGALAHKEKQFNRAHLALGPTEFESRGVGFSISADFERLEFSQWYALIYAITDNIRQQGTPVLGMPQRIFVDTDKFILAGQEFSDVDVTTKRLDDQWVLDIDADQARGKVTIFDDWFGRGIWADLEYIRIAKKEALIAATPEPIQSDKPRLTTDPRTLPNLNITCKSCQLFGFDLGRVEIEAEPNDDGLKLNQLLINNDQGNISASGQWYKRNNDHFTFVAGDLNSNDFGEFLKQLGFDSGIQDSQADMSFALTWKDSPFDIKFKNLDGEIDWRLSDGYLTEVSDQGSRIFTLLSFDSLVRKLSLDFRDVFAKGFFYDKIRGSVQITEGKADTRDTNIDGAAGEIEIYGYTDLAKQELNYNVSFTPNVTGNLPVLVYFFTVSPPSALAALALDQVLTSAKVISNVNYSVTGTIDNPILIETGRESTEVELPARREPLKDDLPPFVPPTTDDLIEIEVKDGQSD